MKLVRCSVCGKMFIPAAKHMYKVSHAGQPIELQCSYTCYRVAGGDPGRRYVQARKEDSR